MTEDLFSQSAASAQGLFSSWENYSHQMRAEAKHLRINFQKLTRDHH